MKAIFFGAYPGSVLRLRETGEMRKKSNFITVFFFSFFLTCFALNGNLKRVEGYSS